MAQQRTADSSRTIVLVGSLVAFGFGFMLDENASPLAAEPESAVAAAAATEPAAKLEFQEPIDWYQVADISLIFVHSGEKLFVLDELDGLKQLFTPIEAPGLGSSEYLLHVPATNFLIFRYARQPDPEQKKPVSIAFDAFGGSRLWKAEPLPSSKELLPFYARDTIVLKSQPDPAGNVMLTGLDYLSGRRWSRPTAWGIETTANNMILAAPTFGLMGSGQLNAELIDPVDGKSVWTVAVPKKSGAAVEPAVGRVLIWSTIGLAMYNAPALTRAGSGSATPVSQPGPVGKPTWTAGPPSGNPKITGVQQVSNEAFLVYGKEAFSLLAASDGHVIWSHPAMRFQNGIWRDQAQLSLSPDRKSGFATFGKELAVIELATGKEKCSPVVPTTFTLGLKMSSNARDAEWLDNSRIHLSITDPYGPNGAHILLAIGEFDATTCQETWHQEVPKAPRFRLTGSQKLDIALQTATSALVTYASAKMEQKALQSGNAALAQRWADTTSMGVNMFVQAVDNGITALKRSGNNRLAEGSSLAAARFKDRLERLRKNSGYYYVTGGGDEYQVVKIDQATGGSATVGSFAQKKVHDIQIDVAYQIQIVLSDNMHVLRLVPFGSSGPMKPDPGLKVPTSP